jgi:hypothetical protein
LFPTQTGAFPAGSARRKREGDVDRSGDEAFDHGDDQGIGRPQFRVRLLSTRLQRLSKGKLVSRVVDGVRRFDVIERLDDRLRTAQALGDMLDSRRRRKPGAPLACCP